MTGTVALGTEVHYAIGNWQRRRGNNFSNFIFLLSSKFSIGEEPVDVVLTGQLPREWGGEMWRVELEGQTEDVQHSSNQGNEYQSNIELPLVTHKNGTYL